MKRQTLSTERQGFRCFGLTGGIGAGKSLAAEHFRSRGVPVIDMDALGREITDESPTVAAEVARVVGGGVLSEGKLDRRKVREAVFRDAKLRRDLENLLHPLILREFDDRRQRLHDEGHRIVLCEAALLIETGRYKQLDGLVVVLAPEALRVRRAVERDRVPEALARQIASAQVTDEARRKAATWTLLNDGDRGKFLAQIDALVDSWREKGWL